VLTVPGAAAPSARRVADIIWFVRPPDTWTL
jgi:hypothetical protein